MRNSAVSFLFFKITLRRIQNPGFAARSNLQQFRKETKSRIVLYRSLGLNLQNALRLSGSTETAAVNTAKLQVQDKYA
jgi:hypothetical protein